ncbi:MULTISPECIES: hypothetical protein [unclassified Sphingomonas]
MTEPETPIHISEEDARAGATPHVVRYVLAISMALIIIVFAVMFMG